MKNNKGLIIVIVILVICLMGTGGYIVYDKFFKEEVNNQDEEKVEINEDELELLGISLYNRSLSKDSFNYRLYRKEVENFDNLNENIRYALTYDYFTKNLKKYNFDGDCFNDGYNQGLNACSTISKDIFEHYYKEFFGIDKNIDYTNFSFEVYDPWLTCSLEGENIACYEAGGGDATNSHQHIQYNHVELEGSDIVIYVDYLFTMIEDGLYENVYNDLSATNLVGTYEGASESELFNKFKEEVGTYKVTFKKDTAGNYYWYSNEFQK